MRKGARVSACLWLWERRRRGERERGGSVLMG